MSCFLLWQMQIEYQRTELDYTDSTIFVKCWGCGTMLEYVTKYPQSELCGYTKILDLFERNNGCWN